MPWSRSLSLSISAHCCRSRLASSPSTIVTRFEWSVMAMYFSPRGLAAAAISSMRGRAVGPRAVHVQVAADVAEFDQRGQLAGVGPLELPPGLAQLGRKAGQVQRRVDLFLRAAGDLFLAAEDAVLVDLQPSRLGPAAEHDVVLLRAGEVLQGGAERLGRHRPQIDLHAGRQPERHFRLAAGDDRGHRAVGGQMVHHGGDVAG